MKRSLSKVLKSHKISCFELLTPDLTPSEEESFKSILREQEETKKDSSKKASTVSPEELVEQKLKEAYEKGYQQGFELGKTEGFQAGYHEGLTRGYEEGKAKVEGELKTKYQELEEALKKEFQLKLEEVSKFLKNLEEEVQALVLNLDKEVLTLALKIAQKMVLKEITIEKETTLNLIKEALNYIAEGIEITLKVNPEEFVFIKENLPQLVGPSSKINLIADPNISKGGVFIETALGVVDATLEKRWERLLAELFKDEG